LAGRHAARLSDERRSTRYQTASARSRRGGYQRSISTEPEKAKEKLAGSERSAQLANQGNQPNGFTLPECGEAMRLPDRTRQDSAAFEKLSINFVNQRLNLWIMRFEPFVKKKCPENEKVLGGFLRQHV
jgi:hypothetical protein